MTRAAANQWRPPALAFGLRQGRPVLRADVTVTFSILDLIMRSFVHSGLRIALWWPDDGQRRRAPVRMPGACGGGRRAREDGRTPGRARASAGGAVGSCERATATMSNKLLAALFMLGPCSLSHSGGCALALTVPQCSSEAIKGGQMGGGDYHNLEQQAGRANATACRAECCADPRCAFWVLGSRRAAVCILSRPNALSTDSQLNF